MKKLAFMFVAVAAISLASCNGNKTADATCDGDSCCADTVVVEEVVDSVATDSVAVDSAAVEAAPEAI
ncbi:MAG: hypothetical protein J6B92_01690 [Paraprevotella sp.]|nr:hypothetical protein [Paraprevotella sp.]